MIASLKTIFKNKYSPEVDQPRVDMSTLDSTFQLLQKTATDVSSLASDVSRRLDEKLKDTEFRLFSIIDSVDDFILVKDGNGRWKTLNKFGQQLYGFMDREYVGKTDWEIAERYPVYKKHLLLCSSSDSITWASGVPQRVEEVFEIDGKLQYFDTIKTPVFDENGNKKEMIIVGRNVTEVKEKQSRVKACFNALNSASDVILICGRFGEIVFCNDNFLNKFGFSSHEDVVGKNLGLLASNVTEQAKYDELWITARANKPWTGVITNKTLWGDEVTCNIHVVPVMNGIPEPIYYICTMKPHRE